MPPTTPKMFFILLVLILGPALEAAHDEGAPVTSPPAKAEPSPNRAAAPPPDEKVKCKDPAAYLCKHPDNRKNQAAVQIAKDRFGEAKKAAESDPKFVNFLKQKKVRNCFYLRDKEAEDCHRLRNQLISDRVLTQDRKTKVEAVFKKAKGAFMSHLDKFTTQENKEKLAWIKKQVGESKLHFGVGYKLHPFGFNMMASSRKPMTKEPQPTVLVQGMALLAEEAPEMFFMAMLHEFGHLFDPCNHPDSKTDPSYAKHPFGGTLECLHTKDSTGAKRADIDCFEKAKSVAEQKKVGVPIGVKNSLKHYKEKKSNCAMLQFYLLWDDKIKDTVKKPCAIPQINEAFADWMAGEAYASQMDANSDLKQALSFVCPDYGRTDNTKAPTHLDPATRINRLFLANPKLAKAWGCEENKNSDPKYCAPSGKEGEAPR